MNKVEFYELGKFEKSSSVEKKHMNALLNLVLQPDFENTRSETLEILRELEKLNVDYYWNGSIHRIDDYVPLLACIDGVKAVGVTEICEGDIILETYAYGKPVLKFNGYLDELRWIKKVAEKHYKIPVIGPYSFTTFLSLSPLIRGRFKEIPLKRIAYKNLKLEYVIEIARLINRILREVLDDKAEVIQINETIDMVREDEMRMYIEGLKESTRGFEDRVILYLGDISSNNDKLLEVIDKLKFRSIVIPVANKTQEELRELVGLLNEYDIGVTFGIINAYEEHVEDIKLIRRRVSLIFEEFKGKYLAFSPNGPLDFIERDYAFKKLYNLKKALEIEGLRGREETS